MKSKIGRSLWIGSLICLLPIAFGLICYNKLPDSMVIHLDYRGKPNGNAPKEFIIFVFPILMMLLNIIINISVAKAAVKGNAAKPLIGIGKWIVPIATVMIQPLIILRSINSQSPVNLIISIMVGLIFILSGNYFPKNRVNPIVGMKFPWLFNDEEGWRKTHKLSSYLWIIAGFILMIAPFIEIPFIIIFIVLISLIGVIPIVYSLCFYIRRKSNHINNSESSLK
ncbi:DUF1648 domain-containing protein [Anaerocolumna sedimenticola]|uniref:DUF1648 domain-containing protein n=1 Tax=Anaerocolumna sedimenticola TaxID=2696063 RepID=A0A6P1TPU3_9FIRM|nr:SdpI family protein [Anaerocolumna sedimenticola]QHQ63004.1 DUF1648 domain-containing protein [Anaerocolumna sedimenticola]